MLVGFFYRQIAPRIGIGIETSELQYYFSHLVIATVLPALLAGYFNFKYGNAASLWAWLVPAAVLAVKVMMYQPSSIFTSKWPEVVHYYFGSDWIIPASVQEAFSTDLVAVRVYIAQTNFTAPFYSGLAYSLGALAKKRLSVRASRDNQQ